jgi:hypothetical protein
VSIGTKLQLKPEHAVAVVRQPDDVHLPIGGSTASSPAEADAVILFVRDRADLDAHARPALEAARRDALAWIAYPKAGKLGTDLNRDRLWEALAGEGVRPVRQIAVDDTWSALRFRPAS